MQNELLKPVTNFGTNLKFTPYAWAKLLWMRDYGPTEVAGYGVTETADPLLVTDFVLVKQECTIVTFDLDSEDSAEYMETMMDKGLMPWQYANILIHTHPGNSPSPSSVDETNFKEAFSHPNWAIMFIIANGGECYGRLKINVGPGSIRELNVAVDWEQSFSATDKMAWKDEYEAKVTEEKIAFAMTGNESLSDTPKTSGCYSPLVDDPMWFNEKENIWEHMSDVEARYSDKMVEEAGCPSEDFDHDFFWDTNGEVLTWDDEDETWYSYCPLSGKWYMEVIDADKDEMQEISKPRQKWADDMLEWADQFASERELVLSGDLS